MWPFKKNNQLELFMQQYLRDQQEIARLEGEITLLRSEKSLVIEAIGHFCPPDMYPSAMAWLERKVLRTAAIETIQHGKESYDY